ncbi:flagellar hook-associated protein FlgK [Saccharibacillus sp. CPCC 101409]|uniref:flagellar hook-associated protein FlgK n=1 Tax=Saccharibacillus sp. CPCC 101409 TaxID=3058041 RepID=UPI002672022A|nr:flagellar hook-associated protein FlgK [Saccharibacillus sp. CPCC 101409]MDO3412084.1 flagellar hook-associated protein FlgK [Saccharibacillus sp. CPCC 101409]
MASTFHGIETARRSLMTQRAALETTGHNIANANTEGYTRQRVNMQASIPMEAYGVSRSLTPGQLGTGVEFTSITRIRETYLDTQFRGENSSLGSLTTQADALSKLEGIVNEPSDTGLRTVMDKFWNSLSDLSKDTESVTARKVVRENALALTDALNQTAKQLSDMGTDLTSNIAIKGKEMQSYMDSIADLNNSITRIESLGDNANDLRDQRDLLTDKLSKIVNVTVTDTDAGYNITMGNQALVTGATATALPVDGAAAKGSALETILSNATGGEVQGMFLARDKYTADYQAQLDQVANTLANGNVDVKIPAGSSFPEGTKLTKDVVLSDGSTLAAGTGFPKGASLQSDTTLTVAGLNGLHQLGFTTDGSSQGGVAFFTSSADGSTTVTASNITLNPVISNDPSKIASSLRLDSSGSAVKGNNGLALLMSDLKTSKFVTTDASGTTTTATLSDRYSGMVGQLGIQAQEINRKAANAESLTAQVDTSRQSVSGVSQDEEMTNLVKFQQAYNASARFMTTYDEMLDKLINSTGTVGR